ncbi:MAG: RlmE family RNA methyltransferase, partial [Pseudomonadota bacterium]|nr:RlmE family RNA methyltransferase [Pseudomonadota bacterium]
RKRSVASTRWLARQLNDPYVLQAKAGGYRSRAAFKLVQLDDKHHFLKKGARVVDLGSAPGGWLQVAAERIGPGGKIVGIDLLPIDPVSGAETIEGDFLAEDAPMRLAVLLGGTADIVLSDMAPSTTGHARTDHLRLMGLIEAAYDFAVHILEKNGTFVAKVFQGGAEAELLARMKRDFATVKHVKPDSSRRESREIFVIARNFKGRSV